MASVIVLLSVPIVAVTIYALSCWPWRQIWTLTIIFRYLRLEKRFPGPPAIPVLGNISSFLTSDRCKTFQRFLSYHKRYGPIYRLWFGPRLYVVIHDPVDIARVLGNVRVRNRDYPMCLALEPFVGESVLSTRDDTWRRHRRLIAPAFHFGALEPYVEVFAGKAAELADLMELKADGRTFDVYHHMGLCTLDAICQTVIGVDMNTQRDGESSFGAAITHGLELIHRRLTHPWLLVGWLYGLTRYSRDQALVLQVFHDFTDKIISTKLDQLNRTETSSLDVNDSNKRLKSVLDLLLESHENQNASLSASELRDEITAITIAGLETTAKTMSFLLVLLGIHPDIQAEIHRELDAIFLGQHRGATLGDLQCMNCLERAIRESLRLFPTAALLPREIGEDVELSGGHVLPAGCTVLIFSYLTQRDGKYYPDPGVFRPDRWLPGEGGASHPYAYLPFSGGPRNCVGQKYAMLQMKSVLSGFLRRFKVTTDCTMTDLETLELSATIQPVKGFPIKLRPREMIEGLVV